MSNDRFAVSVKDVAGAYVRANDAFTNLLGVSPADLPGLTDDHVQPRDVAESLVANDRAALAAAGTILVEEQIFDRLGLRKVAACRFTTEEDGRTLVWRVSGPIQQAAEISAEAERLRTAVMAPAQPAEEPVAAAVVEEPEAVVVEPEPVVVEPEPEPVVVAPEPVMVEPEPVVLAPEPVIAAPEPVVLEPVVVTPAPVIAEPDPEPVAVAPAPVIVEPEPVAVAPESVVVAPEPPAPAPVAAPAPAPVADESATRIARLEHELAEVRSKAALPDPRMQAALRALVGVAEALEQPMRVAPAFRAAAERLGSALGFDAAITWRPGRGGSLVCSSVWTANPEARSFEDECWRSRRAPSGGFTWNPDAMESNGMRTVVTVPIGPAGALELLAVERREPEHETQQALEAVARQLGLVARLTELADLPRWSSVAGNATT